MFRLLVRLPESGEVLFLSQPFKHYKVCGREVETEYGRLVILECLQAFILKADGLPEPGDHREPGNIQMPAEIPA